MMSSIMLLVAQLLSRPTFLAGGVLGLWERLRLQDDLGSDGQVDQGLHFLRSVMQSGHVLR